MFAWQATNVKVSENIIPDVEQRADKAVSVKGEFT